MLEIIPIMGTIVGTYFGKCQRFQKFFLSDFSLTCQLDKANSIDPSLAKPNYLTPTRQFNNRQASETLQQFYLR